MANEKDFDGEGKSGIRVVDRRRFDSDGEEKLEPTAPVQTRAPEKKISELSPELEADFKFEQTSDFTMTDPVESEPSQSDISFGSFVLSLATQALMQLGQLQAPDGITIPVDTVAAKQTIDILAMLQDKTKGNLDSKEQGLLRDALHSLKLAYLRA